MNDKKEVKKLKSELLRLAWEIVKFIIVFIVLVILIVNSNGR